MDDKCNGVKLPERTLPFPTSISQEARAALRRAVGEDGIPVNALHVMPDVSDFNGRMKLKAHADVYYQAAAERLATHVRASVQTVQIDEACVHIATPSGAFPEDYAFIDLHGGALVMGGGAPCRVGAQSQADQHGIRCYGIDYRMPPEQPYPAAAMIAWRSTAIC